MTNKILGISGSPRPNSNTDVLITEALKGAAEVEGIETEMMSLGGEKIMPCIGCFKCIERKDLCIFRHKDFMGEFYNKWLYADGFIIGSPVYHLSITGLLKNAIDRLGQGLWALQAVGEIESRWLMKVGGVLSQGMASFGGQEYAIQYLVSHLLLMNNIVVPPERLTVPGVPGSFRNNREYRPGVIADYDPDSLVNARALGRRVAEITKIIHAGVTSLQGELPAEYSQYVLTKNGSNKILNRGEK